MTNKELVNAALAVWNDRDRWTYLQGAIGDKVESDRARGLYNYFWNMPNHGGNTMTVPYNEWAEMEAGRNCTDCSNFINFLLGYTFSMYSTRGLATLKRFTGDRCDAPPGTVLCLIDANTGECGHVGLAIGNGEFLDFYRYNNTLRKGKISDSLFTYAVYLREVEYNNTDVKSVTVQAVDTEEHYIGDEVLPCDFTVSVEYDDGTVVEEISDFQFTPERYLNTVNVIAVVCKNIINYVVVNALPKGEFYAVQVPFGKDKTKALDFQKSLVQQGYTGTAVIDL